MAKKKYAKINIYRESRKKEREERVSDGTWMRRGSVHDDPPARILRQKAREKEIDDER